MIVGTAGFSGSGSSAINEYLAEFEENQVYSGNEFIVSYFPDGLEDLDYHLNNGASKFLSSTVAIPRFRKAVNHLLEIETNGEIRNITEEFVQSITQIKWLGTGQGQEVLHNNFIYRNLGLRLNMRLGKRIPRNLFTKLKFYPLQEMEFSVNPELFEEKAKTFIDNILKCLNLDLDKNIVLDQPFAGNNPIKSFKYYRNPKAIVVYRDPRDMYTLFKYKFDRCSYVVPIDNVEDFVLYYKKLHDSLFENCNHENVLVVRFEDMIYEYKHTTERIKSFLGLKEHSFPKKFFKPEESMINTRVFNRYPDLLNDTKYIEKELSDYIYDFDKYEYNPSLSDTFVFNPRFERDLLTFKDLFKRRKKDYKK